MIMSIVRHPIRAKYADEWPELSAEFTTATRAEPGNICFDWFRSVEDPNLYLLVEMFRDRAAGDAHVNSDHFKKAQAELPQYVQETPLIRNWQDQQDDWDRLGEFEVSA